MANTDLKKTLGPHWVKAFNHKNKKSHLDPKTGEIVSDLDADTAELIDELGRSSTNQFLRGRRSVQAMNEQNAEINDQIWPQGKLSADEWKDTVDDLINRYPGKTADWLFRQKLLKELSPSTKGQIPTKTFTGSLRKLQNDFKEATGMTPSKYVKARK